MSARSCVGILFRVGAVLLFLLTVSLSAQGAVITHTYDANSRLSTSVSDSGIELAFSYDANGNIGSYTAKGGAGPTAVPDGGLLWYALFAFGMFLAAVFATRRGRCAAKVKDAAKG